MMMARSLLLSPFPGWVTAHSSPPLLSAAALPHTPTHTLSYIAIHCPCTLPHTLPQPTPTILPFPPPAHSAQSPQMVNRQPPHSLICTEMVGIDLRSLPLNSKLIFVTIWNSLFVFAERCHFVAQSCDRKFVPHRRRLQPLRKSTHLGNYFFLLGEM